MKFSCMIIPTFFLISPITYAATTPVLPPSVDPSRVGQQLSEPVENQKAQPMVNHDEKKLLNNAIPNADKIKFVLKKIELSGNTVFTDDQLKPIFSQDLNKTVSLADIQDITKNITLKYRNAGYVISRAVLPAQTIENGVVKIQIIEGYVENSQIQNNANKANNLLDKYGNKISQTRPLNMNTLERYSLLANDMPGMKQVKTVLQPPQTSNAPLGSTDIIFQPDFSKASGFVGFDNRGTKYLGPNEFSAGAAVNSVIQSGDQIGFQGLASSDWHELQYGNIYTLQPLGSNGTTLNLSGSISRTEPGYVLAPLEVQGDSKEIVTDIQTPWIRSRKQSLYSIFSFDYLNSQTDINLFNQNLYDDHIRSGRLAVNYYLQDKWQGANQAGAQLSHGFSFLGASNSNQPNLSRVMGDPQYTKLNLSLSRLQGITNKVSIYLAGISQYTNNPLLSSEQFAFGGTQYGQAYDPAEITGDKGIAAKTELRYSASPGFRYLNNIQYFTFYDIGKVWNIEPESINGLPQQASGASAGLGARINFNAYMYGALEMAKPLTRNVATMNDRNPRYFVSLTITGKTKSTAEEPQLPPPPTGFLGGASTNGPDAKAKSQEF